MNSKRGIRELVGGDARREPSEHQIKS